MLVKIERWTTGSHVNGDWDNVLWFSMVWYRLTDWLTHSVSWHKEMHNNYMVLTFIQFFATSVTLGL